MRMPTTLPSSVTTTEPVSACCIARAAWARLSSAVHVTAGEVMRSRTMVSMLPTMTLFPSVCKC